MNFTVNRKNDKCQHEPVARCTHLTDAFKVVEDGDTVTRGKLLLWHEGSEEQHASSNPTFALNVAQQRMQAAKPAATQQVVDTPAVANPVAI